MGVNIMREQLAISDSTEEIQAILNSIEDINAPSYEFYDDTPLIWATHYGYNKIVVALLQHPQINPNIQDEDGFAALIWAAYKDYKQIVTVLLQHPQANPNIQNKYGDTALTIAFRQGHNDTVSIIKDHLREKSTATIRQTARLLYQDRYSRNDRDRTNECGFFKLSDETNKAIAALTGDPSVHSETQIKGLATEGFSRINLPSPSRCSIL